MRRLAARFETWCPDAAEHVLERRHCRGGGVRVGLCLAGALAGGLVASPMSFQVVRTRTSGQERRRTARIARRATRGVTAVSLMPRVTRTRRTFKEWRAYRKANREKSDNLITTIQARLAAWRDRLSRAPRCPYSRVEEKKGLEVFADPCGGKLRAYRENPKADAVQRCQKCGRAWQWVGVRLERAS